MDTTAHELNDPFRLEERLMPKLRQAEYLLPLVISLMLWTAGFVDMLTHVSPDPQLFGVYSVPFFLALLVYTLGFGGWFRLIFPQDSIDVLKRGLAYAHRRPWLALGITAGLVGLILSLLIWDMWFNFPLLSAALLLLSLMWLVTFLLVTPAPDVKLAAWRKAALSGLAVLAVLEIGLQGAAGLRLLRGFETYAGIFVPYGRVYQAEEGYGNASTNRYGWYYPPFRLESGTRRLILTGDAFVQGVQVMPKQNLGVMLEKGLNAAQPEAKTEVLGLGFPGYGPGVYAEPKMFPITSQPFAPSEVIVVFHLANDIQTTPSFESGPPHFIVTETGEVDVHPNDVYQRHGLWHAAITGYETLNPLRALRSQFFTFTWFEGAWRQFRNQPAELERFEENTASANADQPFGKASFFFTREDNPQASQARVIAIGILKKYHDYLASVGVTMRVVTVPFYPASFFAQPDASAAMRALGEYDVLAAEARFTEAAEAAGLDVLPMTAYINAAGLTPEAIQDLYFKDGAGHFTAAGHTFFAEAIQACLYQSGPTACPLP